MSIKRAWYLFILTLITFAGISYVFSTTLVLTLGTTTLTIVALYLIMVTANAELRRATEQEVKAFVEKLEGVTGELKNVTQATLKAAEGLSRVEAIIARMAGKTEELVSIQERELAEHVELLRPRILINVESRQALLFWRNYFLTVWNIGGDARDLQVSYQRGGQWVVMNQLELTRNRRVEYDCGNTGSYKDISSLPVHARAYDVEGRLYEGSSLAGFDISQSTEIPMISRPSG